MFQNELSTSREASIRAAVWMLSFIIIGITAWFSNGYFHADEHYQIIEFAGYKVGWNQEHELAWEFQRQIRPTLQPWIASGIIKVLYTFGIKDPFQVTFVLRFLMGISLLFALRFFYNKSSSEIILNTEKQAGFYRISYFILLVLTWFIPFLSIRFSSETAAASAILVALGYFIHSNWKNDLFLIGIWLGIAFAFRFQVGFGIFGIGLWFLALQRKNLNVVWQLALGFLVVLIVSFFIDSLFYQKWVFTPWNYFQTNILEGESSTFGESGLSYYLLQSFWLPTSLLGGIFLVAFLYNLIFNVKSPLIWFFVFFIVGHLLIGHKEERFLFPLAFLLVYLVFFMLTDLIKKIGSKKWIIWFTSLFVVYNLFLTAAAFPAMSLETCGLGRTKIIQYINRNYPEKITFIRPWYANPYNPWEGLPQNFYLKRNLIDIRVDNVQQFQDTLTSFNGTILVCVSEGNLLIDGYQKALKQEGFKQVERSVSEYKYKLDTYTKAINKSSILYLYEKKQ